MRRISLPIARFGSRAAIWVLVAFLGICALFAGGVAAVRPLTVVDERVFLGTLRQGHDPISVLAPKDSVIAEVAVIDGDIVRKGQTLISFDADALEYKMQRAEVDILGLQMERACILDPQRPIPSNVQDLAVETKVALRFAQERCRSFHVSDLKDVAAAKAVLDGVHLEQEILRKNTARLEVGFAKGGTDTTRVDQFLKTLIVRRNLDADLLKAEQSLFALEQKIKDRRLAQAVALDQNIHALKGGLRHLQMIAESPRIIAPIAGRVLRVRPVTIGSSLPTQTELVQIISDHAGPYSLDMHVSIDVAKSISAGRKIRFSVLGFDGRDRVNLVAIWPDVGLHPADGDQNVTVTLDIDDKSQDILAMRGDDLTRWQGGARAQVRLQMAHESFGTVLTEAVKDFFPVRGNVTPQVGWQQMMYRLDHL